jgi:P4 family phage/plasmid primase-like protien
MTTDQLAVEQDQEEAILSDGLPMTVTEKADFFASIQDQWQNLFEGKENDDERDPVQHASHQQSGQSGSGSAPHATSEADSPLRVGTTAAAQAGAQTLRNRRDKVAAFTDPEDMADLFLEKIGHLVYWQNRYWQYHDRYYREIPSHELKARVRKHLIDERARISETTKSGLNITSELVANTIATLEAKCLKESYEPMQTLKGQPDRDFLPLDNGLLDLDTLELLSHTPDYFSLTLLPFDYDPEAKCPQFLASLERSFKGHPDAEGIINLLREWFGYILSRSLVAQKFLVIHGPPGSGKTTLVSPLQAMLGKDNVSFVDLSAFSQDFGLAPMFGRKVNIAGDVGKVNSINEGLLKKLVDGSGVTINEKNKPIMNVVPTAKLVFVTNDLPHFDDKNGSVYRRLLLVHMDRVVSKEERDTRLADPDWWAKSGEMPGILNWSLGGLADLKRNGFQFTIPPSVMAAVDHYRLDNDKDRRFVVEHFEANPEKYVSCNWFYERYEQWCKRNGHKGITSRNKLYKVVMGVYPEVRKDGKRIKGYRSPQESLIGLAEKTDPV